MANKEQGESGFRLVLKGDLPRNDLYYAMFPMPGGENPAHKQTPVLFGSEDIHVYSGYAADLDSC